MIACPCGEKNRECLSKTWRSRAAVMTCGGGSRAASTRHRPCDSRAETSRATERRPCTRLAIATAKMGSRDTLDAVATRSRAKPCAPNPFRRALCRRPSKACATRQRPLNRQRRRPAGAFACPPSWSASAFSSYSHCTTSSHRERTCAADSLVYSNPRLASDPLNAAGAHRHEASPRSPRHHVPREGRAGAGRRGWKHSWHSPHPQCVMVCLENTHES